MNPTNSIMGSINSINGMNQGFAKPLAMARPMVQGGQPKPSGLQQSAQRFLGGGMYNKGGVKSVGGHIGPFGGALGLDRGKPFGSANINGRMIGHFGPQG